MSLKRNEWKVLQLLTLSTIIAIFSASLSKVNSIQPQAILELTIEERLATIREHLKYRAEKISGEFDYLIFLKNSTEHDATLLTQWSDYWNDWNDSPWGDWSDRYWNDWNDSPWSDWSDRYWNDWSDWNNYW